MNKKKVNTAPIIKTKSSLGAEREKMKKKSENRPRTSEMSNCVLWENEFAKELPPSLSLSLSPYSDLSRNHQFSRSKSCSAARARLALRYRNTSLSAAAAAAAAVGRQQVELIDKDSIFHVDVPKRKYSIAIAGQSWTAACYIIGGTEPSARDSVDRTHFNQFH